MMEIAMSLMMYRGIVTVLLLAMALMVWKYVGVRLKTSYVARNLKVSWTTMEKTTGGQETAPFAITYNMWCMLTGLDNGILEGRFVRNLTMDELLKYRKKMPKMENTTKADRKLWARLVKREIKGRLK